MQRPKAATLTLYERFCFVCPKTENESKNIFVGIVFIYLFVFKKHPLLCVLMSE